MTPKLTLEYSDRVFNIFLVVFCSTQPMVLTNDKRKLTGIQILTLITTRRIFPRSQNMNRIIKDKLRFPLRAENASPNRNHL